MVRIYCLRTETNSHRFYSALSNQNHKFADIFRLLRNFISFSFSIQTAMGTTAYANVCPAIASLCVAEYTENIWKNTNFSICHIYCGHIHHAPIHCRNDCENSYSWHLEGKKQIDVMVNMGSNLNTQYSHFFCREHCKVMYHTCVIIGVNLMRACWHFCGHRWLYKFSNRWKLFRPSPIWLY